MATATRTKDDAATAKDKERLAKEKEKAARQKEKEKAAKAKEKEKAAKAKEKERLAKAKEKERLAKAKEKEKAAKAKEKERLAKQKEKDAAKAEKSGKSEKSEKSGTSRSAAKGAGTGPKGRGGSTRPARSTPSRTGSPKPQVHEKGWIAEELGKADAVTRSTKRPTLAASFTTRDADVIRRWAESRGGVPADVRGTGDGSKGGAGVLRIEFRDEADRLEQVDWDAFFETFRASDVDFLYQEFTKDGGESRFHKIVRTED